MLMDLNLNHIERICQETDDRLWSAYLRSTGDNSDTLYDPRLIFPVYSGRKDGTIRVSEQEARFVFTESLTTTPYYFSIETPTRQGYQLTGKRKMSAQTDLTLYARNRQPVLNVEFKAKGFSASARNLSTIKKDLQKLLREPIAGMWFHILQSVDNSTLPKLFGAITKSLCETIEEFQRDIKKTQLIFHFCILKHHFSLHKHIVITSGNNLLDELNGQFDFSYTVNRSSLIDVHNDNGWFVYKLW